jgi:hypothetical protein
MVKSKIRRWCEETAHEFGCSFTKQGEMWTVTQKATGKVAYQSKYLIDCRNFFLKEIHKHLGKKMGVVRKA